MTNLAPAVVEALAVWDNGAYSCACPDACPTLPCHNDRDDLYTTVAAAIDAARAEGYERGKRDAADFLLRVAENARQALTPPP